jgi:glycosyltransferase involved in cell wall biosynthesis
VLNLVSVIIPIFNRFNLVEKSIESVLIQKYTEYEIIVVDDCSTVGKFSYINERLTIYRLNENSGPGFCRQFGLEKAKGNYILFLDSDDLLEPDFLSLSIQKHIELNNEICFTYCLSGILYSDLTWNNTNKQYDSIFPTLLKGRQWPTAALLWNKKFLPNWNNYRSWEDYDIEFRAALKCNKIGYVNKKLVHISTPNENSLSGKKKNFSQIENQWKVLNFLTDNKLAYNALLVPNQFGAVWNNVKLRKVKIIRDYMDLNVKITNELFNQVTTNKLELIIYKLLNTVGVKFLRLYIKLKIRSLNSCVDYSVI